MDKKKILSEIKKLEKISIKLQSGIENLKKLVFSEEDKIQVNDSKKDTVNGIKCVIRIYERGKEYKIGECFKIVNSNIKVMEHMNNKNKLSQCENCFFHNDDDCKAPQSLFCFPEKRKDGKYVYFEELKK